MALLCSDLRAVSSGCRFLRPLRLILSGRGRCKSTAVLQEKSASDEAQRASDPLLQPDYFGVRQLVKMRDLYKQRVHWGHKEGVRNPYMTPYIFGSRLGVDIIDIEKSTSLLKDALNFTAHVAYQGGVILFISRSKQNMSLIEKTAVECDEYSHCRYWSGGVFTNASMQFGCVTRLPDLCIFINTLNNVFNQHAAVVHAAKMLIPSVGIVDTNCDPRLITYPVPGNDDTPCAVQYYCQLFSKAIKAGKAKRKEDDTWSE